MIRFNDPEMGELAQLAALLGATMQVDPELLDPPEDPADPNVLRIPTDPAEPPVDPSEPPAPAPGRRTRQPSRAPTWEDVEKARQEERDKLYPRLTKVDEMQAQLQSLTEERAAAAKAEAKRLKQIEEAEKAAEREKMTAQELIEANRAEFEAKLAEQREATEKIQATYERERQFTELQNYMTARMADEAEAIMPQLRRTVGGNTKEEIDAAIEDAKTMTAEIMGEIQGRAVGQRAQQVGTRTTAPPVGPAESQEAFKEMTVEDINNMDMGQYAQFRDRLLKASGDLARGQRR
jgi:DNA repair exonuclease SbcCD ATPase subunit